MMRSVKDYIDTVIAAIRGVKKTDDKDDAWTAGDILPALKAQAVSEAVKTDLAKLEEEIKLWEQAGLDSFFERYGRIMEAVRSLEDQGLPTREIAAVLVKRKDELKITLLQRSYREMEAQLTRLRTEKRKIGCINDYMELVERHAGEYASSGAESYQMLKNRLNYLRSQVYCARACKYS